MLYNHLKSTLRFLARNRLFAGINIVGLSLALAASFLILLFVINELSYNTGFKNRKQVYRVLNYYEQISTNSTGTSFALYKSIKDEFPQVKEVAPMGPMHDFKIKLNGEFIPISYSYGTSSDLFKIFDLSVTGQQEHILDGPNSIVLSETQAKKFFPDEDPIGKDLIALINEKEEVFTVKGVFDDIPENSTLKAECFINSKWRIDQLNKQYEDKNAETNWRVSFGTTWLLLDKNADVSAIDPQFRALENKVWGENDKNNFSLQSLADAYLYSSEIEGVAEWGNLKHIRIFSAIAVLIIIVAAFNYIILSTAVSTGRAKEIGIRKTNGASVQSIQQQMLSESVVLSVLVFPLALCLAWMGKPFAEELFQTKLLIFKSNIIVYVAVYLLLTLFIGLASGLYTSSFLSKLNVISILNGSGQRGNRKTRLRSALIVTQLVIFCSFVSGTLIIRSQYNYALHKDPGFENKDILFVDFGRNMQYSSTFMSSITAYPDVVSVGGAMDALPASYSSFPYNVENAQDQSISVKCELVAVGYNFLKIMGIDVVDGRGFSEDFGSDIDNAFILNETAVKALGIEDPVGKKVSDGIVIGVVKDFNLFSVRDDIPPIILMASNNFVRQVAVRYKAGSLGNLLPLLKAEWEKVIPGEAFSYKTVDELNKEIYTKEKNLSVIVSISSLFSLLITSFGLFGLTLYIIRTQTKEIGLKKVLGSSGNAIILSVLRKNLIMVIAATVLSAPLTLYIMNRWLSTFSFKINIGWWVFGVSFMLATLVVISTVFYHAFRASRINPVTALKYE